ncbi:hypothetical protein [Mesorhizobium sp. BE184]|uniref:hypothetical protein n=1 Tax=Mesorhizobium sp. BE184 TaxID=2817714 RepID=UPI00286456A0|nr:hypothetical protein [Mesorhizobium sp. BE184]MDR7032446.1 hypothetical protein [Mesorhizobium sp. BE184]
MQSRLLTDTQLEFQAQKAALDAAQARGSWPTLFGFTSPWLALVLVACFVFATFLSIISGEPRHDRANYDKALNMWLADCTKTVDQCAAEWDKGYTLREIYGKRARG